MLSFDLREIVGHSHTYSYFECTHVVLRLLSSFRGRQVSACMHGLWAVGWNIRRTGGKEVLQRIIHKNEVGKKKLVVPLRCSPYLTTTSLDLSIHPDYGSREYIHSGRFMNHSCAHITRGEF